jgi:hypothetical protein
MRGKGPLSRHWISGLDIFRTHRKSHTILRPRFHQGCCPWANVSGPQDACTERDSGTRPAQDPGVVLCPVMVRFISQSSGPPQRLQLEAACEEWRRRKIKQGAGYEQKAHRFCSMTTLARSGRPIWPDTRHGMLTAAGRAHDLGIVESVPRSLGMEFRHCLQQRHTLVYCVGRLPCASGMPVFHESWNTRFGFLQSFRYRRSRNVKGYAV